MGRVDWNNAGPGLREAIKRSAADMMKDCPNTIGWDYQSRSKDFKSCGASLNILAVDEEGFFANTNKAGNRSWARAFYIYNPITWLRTCDLCGKTSTPKKIQNRYYDIVGDWNKPDLRVSRRHRLDAIRESLSTPSKNMLCMSCRNILAPICRREEEAYESKVLINKLYREVLKCQKSQTQANLESFCAAR